MRHIITEDVSRHNRYSPDSFTDYTMRKIHIEQKCYRLDSQQEYSKDSVQSAPFCKAENRSKTNRQGLELPVLQCSLTVCQATVQAKNNNLKKNQTRNIRLENKLHSPKTFTCKNDIIWALYELTETNSS